MRKGTLWCEPGSGLRTITCSRVTESVPDRGLEAADRQLGWLMSLAGVVLIATTPVARWPTGTRSRRGGTSAASLSC